MTGAGSPSDYAILHTVSGKIVKITNGQKIIIKHDGYGRFFVWDHGEQKWFLTEAAT
jgi:hypothetical protein